MERRGIVPEAWITRAASITIATLQPLSSAPVPKSHESRCAPSRTNSSGFLATADFGHHVFRFHRTADVVRHLEMHADRLIRSQETRHALGVLASDNRLRQWLDQYVVRRLVTIQQQVRPRGHPEDGCRSRLLGAFDDGSIGQIFTDEILPSGEFFRMDQHDRAARRRSSACKSRIIARPRVDHVRRDAPGRRRRRPPGRYQSQRERNRRENFGVGVSFAPAQPEP